MNAIGDIVDMLVAVLVVPDTTTPPITYTLNYADDGVLVLFRKGYLACEGQTLYTQSYMSLQNNQYLNGSPSTTFVLPDLRGQFARSITQGVTLPSYATRPGDPVVEQTGTNPLGDPNNLTSLSTDADWRYANHDHTTNFDYTIDTTSYLQHSHSGQNFTANPSPLSTQWAGTGFTPPTVIPQTTPNQLNNVTEPATTITLFTPNYPGTFSVPPVVTWALNYLPEVLDTANAYYDPYLGASNADECAPVHATIVKCIRFK